MSGPDGVALWRLPAMQRLLVLTLLCFTSFFLTLAALPVQAAREGAGVSSAGLVTTAMLACTVGSQPLVPAAVARFGLRRVLTTGLVLLGAPSPAALLVATPAWLMVVSGLRGVGFAVLTVLVATLAAQVAPAAQRGRAVGLYGLAVAVPNLLAVPAGAALTLGGRFDVVALAAVSPVLALPLIGPLLRRAGPVARSSERLAVRTVARVVVPSVMLLVVTLAGGGLVTFLPLARPGGSTVVLALGAYGVTGAITRWGAGVASDRWGTRLLLPAALVTAALGLTAVASGLTLDVGAPVVVAAAVFGAGYGAVQNLTLVEAFARAPSPGPASAVWNLCFDAGTALGAVVVGVVAAAGPGVAGAYVACALLIVLALPLALLRGGR